MIPTAADLAAIDDDPVRCFDSTASAAMVAEVEQAQKDGDTLGGVVEVVVWGLPPGWVPMSTGIAAWTRSWRVR